MNSLIGKTEKETKEIIKSGRKRLKFCGYDSVSFIKILKNPERLVFNVKAKNNCGYKCCNVDEDIVVLI